MLSTALPRYRGKIRAAIVFFTLLCPLVSTAADPKYGPKDKPLAVPLAADNAYFREGAPAPDFWALSPFYTPQFNSYACSAAAAAMALNALLNTARVRGDEEQNIDQQELIAGIPDWNALLSKEGLKGRHGVTLEQLTGFLAEVLKARGAGVYGVLKQTRPDLTEKSLLELHTVLEENERNPNDIMLAHFTQDSLTLAKGGPYPHVSPIGAYDAKRRRVLIFDVDRQYYEPYWVSELDLLKAMTVSTPDFGRGGFVLIGKRDVKN